MRSACHRTPRWPEHGHFQSNGRYRGSRIVCWRDFTIALKLLTGTISPTVATRTITFQRYGSQ